MKDIIKWVIAVGFSGLLVPVMQKLFSLIPWGKLVDTANWQWLVIPKISILSAIVFLVLLIVVIPLSKKLFKTTVTNSREQQLKRINHLADEQAGVKVTWDVGIGSFYDNNPFAYNIQIFCTKHGQIPIRMIHGRCTDPSCQNAKEYFNERVIKNHIESLLLHEKDKMNGIST